MNKKIFIPIIAAVMVLPGMYLGGIVPISVHTEGYSPLFNNEELTARSELIVHGTLVQSDSYVKWDVSGNNVVPSVYTTWNLQSHDSLKGKNSIIIEFVVDGGSYNNISQQVMHDTKLNEGDNVIVFLSKDTDSVYEDNYYMTGIESGIYKIENGFAKNSFTNSQYDVNSLKSLIRSFN